MLDPDTCTNSFCLELHILGCTEKVACNGNTYVAVAAKLEKAHKWELYLADDCDENAMRVLPFACG